MTHNLTNLEAARLLIAKLTDTDKLALLSDQLLGGLGFDSPSAADLMQGTSDAFDAEYRFIEEAIEADLIDRSEDYDGGRWDFAASRGLVAA
jgi:hypothetical protein